MFSDETLLVSLEASSTGPLSNTGRGRGSVVGGLGDDLRVGGTVLRDAGCLARVSSAAPLRGHTLRRPQGPLLRSSGRSEWVGGTTPSEESCVCRAAALAALLLILVVGVAVAKPEERKPAKEGAAAPGTPAPAKPRPKLDPVKDFIMEYRFALDPVGEPPSPEADRFGPRPVTRSAASPALRAGDLDLKAIAAVLEKRLPILSLDPGEVEVVSPTDLRVRVPFARMSRGALKQFVRAGQLEVRRLDDIMTTLNPGGKYLIDTLNVNGAYSLRFRDRRSNKVISAKEYALRCPLLADTGDMEPDSAHRVGEGVQMGVRVQLNERATKRLRDFQKKPGRMAAVFLDGELLSVNAVTEKFRPPKRKRNEPRDETLDEIDITAGFGNSEEAGYLANVLNSGALPYPLKVVSQGIMGGKTAPPLEEEPLPDPAGT